MWAACGRSQNTTSLESGTMTLWPPGRRMLKVSIGDAGFLIDLFQGQARNRPFREAS